MIKFFRKIRQEMLTKNQYFNYFLFALAEIFLVVVGILIAFQIDNWSEQEKRKIEEKKMLVEIKTALEEDVKTISRNIKTHRRYKASCEILLEVLSTNTPYSDSLDVHFGRMSNHSNFFPNISAYETLKSKGLDLISNDVLKIQIADYYEHDIKLAFAFEKTNESIYPIAVEMYYENFDSWKFLNSAKPRDFESLQKTPKFQSYLYSTASIREMEINMFQRLLGDCSSLIDLIQDNLNKQ